MRMTGFGHGEQRMPRCRCSRDQVVEHRYLELFINLPYSLKQLEPRTREYLFKPYATWQGGV